MCSAVALTLSVQNEGQGEGTWFGAADIGVVCQVGRGSVLAARPRDMPRLSEVRTARNVPSTAIRARSLEVPQPAIDRPSTRSSRIAEVAMRPHAREALEERTG